jgi:hypothetical protein
MSAPCQERTHRSQIAMIKVLPLKARFRTIVPPITPMAKEIVPAISAETRQVKAKLGLLFRKRTSLTGSHRDSSHQSGVRRAEAGTLVTQIFPASFYCCVVALTRSRFDDSFCACSFSICVLQRT